MKPACTDLEFINLWRQLGSPTLVAKHLSISDRCVKTRRNSIESRYQIELPTTNNQSNLGKHSDRNPEHPGRVELSVKNGTVIIFSDAHYWPDIISPAHKALLHFIKELQPTLVICNGDAFDGGAISRFPRIGWDEKPTVVNEIRGVTERLTEIEDLTKSKLVWTLGNHDSRYETFLAARVPEFQGVKGFTLKEHFPRWMPAWACWLNKDDPLGKTVIKHRYRGGVHATHNNTVNSGCSIVTGHLHSLKVTPFSDYNGNRFGVDTGTLADPYGPQFQDYAEDNPNNHRSGFAILTYHKGMLLWPELVHVIEGTNEVEFRGKIIKV